MGRPPAMLLASCLLALALAGCTTGDIPTETDDEGNTIGPSWTFTDTDGEPHSRDSSRGDPVILFFMATWCSSCRSKTAPLAEIHADYQDQGLQIYSLSWDPSETENDLERWKDRYDQSWPHGIDPGNQIAKTFQVTAQSSFVFLDHNGLVVERFGYPGPSENTMRQTVEKAFQQQAQNGPDGPDA